MLSAGKENLQLRKIPTSRFQTGPTIVGAWQVLDLTTGIAAKVSMLSLHSMSKIDAVQMCGLLNERDLEFR